MLIPLGSKSGPPVLTGSTTRGGDSRLSSSSVQAQTRTQKALWETDGTLAHSMTVLSSMKHLR